MIDDTQCADATIDRELRVGGLAPWLRFRAFTLVRHHACFGWAVGVGYAHTLHDAPRMSARLDCDLATSQTFSILAGFRAYMIAEQRNVNMRLLVSSSL